MQDKLKKGRPEKDKSKLKSERFVTYLSPKQVEKLNGRENVYEILHNSISEALTN